MLIVIPTLEQARGEQTGKLALATAGCEARLVVVHDVDKQGFTKTANEGFRQREADEDVCLLNDDVERFCYGWLRILQTALYSTAQYGLAGPSGKSQSGTRTGVRGGVGIQVVKMLPFWCVLIKSVVVDKIGYLDERFIHYSSDTWYCKDANRAGWKCAWVKSVFLGHASGASGYHAEWREHDTAVFKVREREIEHRYRK